MITDWKTIIWQQKGAAIDMLENAIVACPADVWGDKVDWFEFWYLTSHTLFWLDFYMSESREGFAPPAPFGMEEMDPDGKLPPRVYSKDELLTYLNYGRNKCRAVVQSLTDENAHQPCGSKRPGLTNVELLLYSMRHVQHHTAQLNLLLRQRLNAGSPWVSKSKTPLEGN